MFDTTMIGKRIKQTRINRNMTQMNLAAESMDRFIGRYIEKGSDEDLSDLYPFLSKKALQKLARYLLEKRELDPLEDLMPYV